MSTEATIWLVDDDPIYRFAFVRIAQKLGFTMDFQTFNDGFEAWKVMENLVIERISLPTLILLDINMPVMNGWEFLNQFATIDLPIESKSKIVMVSSSTDPKDTNKAQQFPEVMGYLSKPINEETMISLLTPYNRFSK
jgi:CheY-like chemotaxis protein